MNLREVGCKLIFNVILMTDLLLMS